jgi:hypothetical protein
MLGGVVDHGQQGQLGLGPEGQPAVAAAVQVHQFAEARPRLAAPAMPAAGPALGHQAGRLQRLLDERVGQRHAVLSPGGLIEVPDIEPGVAVPGPVPVPVELQKPLHLGHRHRPRRGPTAPVIEQPVVAVLLIAPPQPAHRPWAHP